MVQAKDVQWSRRWRATRGAVLNERVNRPVREMAFGVAFFLATTAHARADERLFSSVYWPRSVTLRVAPLAPPRVGPPRQYWRTDNAGEAFPGGVGRPGGKAGVPATAGAPGAAPDPVAVKKRDETVRALDHEANEVNRGVIELTGSAGDVVRLALSGSKKQLLRPLLLFLVERGVLTAAEVDVWMQADDVQPLLDRVRLAIERLEDRREALAVRKYLLEKNTK